MARPSGLASDHHPEGPGDAPRRRKSTKGTPSVEFSQGSKRAASPSHDPVSPAPKRKRVQSDDHDQLARELEESVSRAQSQTSDGFASARKSILRHTRRNSEPVVAYPDIDEEDYDDLLRLAPGRPHVPTVVLTDGTVLVEPDVTTLTAHLT